MHTHAGTRRKIHADVFVKICMNSQIIAMLYIESTLLAQNMYSSNLCPTFREIGRNLGDNIL